MLLGLFMEVLCTSAARVFSQSRSAELSYTQLQLSSQLFSGQRLAACFSQSHRHSAELSHTQLQLSSQRGGQRLAAGFWFWPAVCRAAAQSSVTPSSSYSPVRPNSTVFDGVDGVANSVKRKTCACSGQRLAAGGWLVIWSES